MKSDGLLGHRDVVLWHLQHGFWQQRFAGAAAHRRRVNPMLRRQDARELLAQYALRMRGIAGEQPMPSHTLSEFDVSWRLLPHIEPRTVGLFRASLN